MTRRSAVLLGVAAYASANASAQPILPTGLRPSGGPGPSAADSAAVHEALGAWAPERAHELVASLAERFGDHPEVRMLEGLVAFERGEYAVALEHVRAALERERTRESWKALRDLIEATARETRDFVEERSLDGRFIIRHRRGADAVLAPYAFETLERQANALEADLNVRLPAPVRLEVYPDGAALSRVSLLTLREIESSGAIALCKWSRLMIVSPRALVHGYPWRDTIAHELTHLALSRMTSGRAPMWLHEGLAKFEETRWRSDPPGRLSPMAGLLLDRAVAGNRLIPFRRLHPSIAKLPTQNDAALAFAEVYTFVRYLHGRMDYAGLRSALARVRDGEDAGAALAAIAGPGITFQRLLDGWNDQIARRPNGPPNASAARPQPLRFRRTDGPNGDGGDDSAAAARIERPRLRNLVRLGDILWGAVRPRAAAIEYERAHRLDAHDPIIANRLARSLVVTGQARRVADVLRPTLDLYPEFAPSWSNLGAAQAALQERARAGASYREALGLNPFDPEVHCALSTLARTDGDSAGAARHERACQTLRGRP